jgi:hypothetical protein
MGVLKASDSSLNHPPEGNNRDRVRKAVGDGVKVCVKCKPIHHPIRRIVAYDCRQRIEVSERSGSRQLLACSTGGQVGA